MKIHKIYIIGKYRSEDKIQKRLNIAKAGIAAMGLCQKGWLTFCPHLNTGGFDDAMPDISEEFWLELGSRYQEDCEAVYLLKDFEQSVGGMAEFKNAQKWGQMIFEQGKNEPPDLNKVLA